MSYRFDRILVTAACSQVPEALTQQLAKDGIMIFPFDDGRNQTLTQITNTSQGLVGESLEKVSFVPLLPGLA